jgi:hypothetical protein
MCHFSFATPAQGKQSSQPALPGLGSRLAAGPFDKLRAGSLGLASMAIAVSFLSQLALDKLAAGDDQSRTVSISGSLRPASKIST